MAARDGASSSSLSAPTAAKSVEDTAFYRYGRLLSRNEVGSRAVAVRASRPAALPRRQRRSASATCRCALLATATHDHKRGEDTRARLAVLSEIPGEWETALQRWTRLNAPLKRDLDGPAPDAADEIMLYQTLVAAWPLDLAPDDAEGLAAFEERVAAWQEKALREAKRHSGWAAPNAEYEGACRAFLAACLDPTRARSRAEIAAFAARIAPHGRDQRPDPDPAAPDQPRHPRPLSGHRVLGFLPGRPRQPAPGRFRRAASARSTPASDPAALLAHWRDGRVKQAIIARALAFRARAPGLFTVGAYQPIRVEGPAADHILAFVRVHEGRAAVAVGTRLSARCRKLED